MISIRKLASSLNTIIVICFLSVACSTTSSETHLKATDQHQMGENLEPITESATSNSEIIPSEKTCIGTFEDFAYTILGKDEDSPTQVLPLYPWQPVSSIPDPADDNRWDRLNVEISRSIDGRIEIWIQANLFYSNKDGQLNSEGIHEFLVFTPATQSWQRVPAYVGNTGVRVDSLFVTKEGEIWGRNHWITGDEKIPIQDIPVMSKFNQQIKSFEFVEDQIAKKDTTGPYVDHFSWAEVVLDQEDIFWFLINKDAIYQFNPYTGISQPYVEIPEIEVVETALTIDGHIYFLQRSHSVELQETIFEFAPDLSEVVSLGIPNEPWPNISSMLVDHNGRLWLNAVGWRDPDGTWQLTHPNSEGYFKNANSALAYRWATPKPTLESSNGILWFSRFTQSFNGTAWLNPVTGEGCWFTTEYSNIVEDHDHSLWLVADEKLYKNDLVP